jgi:hypothetical protein
MPKEKVSKEPAKPRKKRVTKKKQEVTIQEPVLTADSLKTLELAEPRADNLEGYPPSLGEIESELQSRVSEMIPDIPLANDIGQYSSMPSGLEIEVEPQIKREIVQLPTRSEVIKSRVGAISSDQNERSRKRISEKTKQAKLDKEVAKSFENTDEFYPQKLRICQKLNSYREKYSQLFDFPWKKEYTTDMDLQYLTATEASIELLLNTRHLPSMLKSVMIQMTEVAELVSMTVNYPYFNLRNTTRSVKAAADTGYFDDEFDQIAIQFADYLAKPPLVRLGFKWGGIALTNITANSPMLTGGNFNAKTAPKMNPENLKKYSDL